MPFFTVSCLFPSARQRSGFFYLGVALGLLLATPERARAQTTTYAYTGAPQYYDVPAGVTLVRVVATGASGGSLGSNAGGLGAQVQALAPVVAGEQLTLILGGQGASATTAPNMGGNNGGGNGTSGSTPLVANGTGGGGATDLRRAPASPTGDYLTSRNALLVAGGGGGSGNGGLGSGLAGGAGGTPTGGAGSGSGGGAGATQSQAGSGATSSTGGAGVTSADGGGGGGGGYYGGGGGRNASGGGGGSSWATADAMSVSYSTAPASGNGTLSITPVSPDPLPVQLVQFAAQRTALGTVILHWVTASEQHNAGFEVQRAADGIHWLVLAFLPGAGSSAQAHAYVYTDAATPAGAAYYRLRQVDQSGTVTYSPVQAVAGGAASSALVLYPNPAVGTSVQVSPADSASPLCLFNVRGQLVRESPPGSTRFDLTGLPAGVYVVRSGQATGRLVVQP